jgi:uncharacterized membrane protein required for colicin V production
MNGIDFVMVLMLLLSLLAGWKIKSIRLLAVAAAILLGAWAGHYFQNRLVESFQEHMTPENAAWLAWLTPFAITAMVVFMLGMVLSAVFESVRLAWLVRAAGAALACLATAMLLAALAGWIQTSRTAYWHPLVKRSRLVPPLLKTTQPLLQTTAPWWPSVARPLFQTPPQP